MRKLPICAIATAAALSASAPAGAATKVKVLDDVYSPTSLTVSKGTTVKWVWKGKAPHNVTVTKGPKKFHSTTQTKGSYSKKLTTKGTYTILCTIHSPDMKMTVKVK